MAISNITSAFHRTTTTGVTQLAFNAPQTPTSGHILLMDCGCTGGAHITEIDQTNVAWSNLFAITGDESQLELWIGVVSASASTAVTIKTSGSVSFIYGKYSEWSGLGTSLNGRPVTNLGGNANTAPTQSLVTTYANVLLLANLTSPADSYSSGPTNSFISIASSGAPVGSVPMTEGAYRIVSATGTYSTQWTVTGGNFWDNWLVAIGDASLIPITGTGTEHDGGPAFTGTGAQNFSGTGAEHDGGPAFVASGALNFSGTGAEHDGGPAFTGAGAETFSGSGTEADGGPAFAASGAVTFSGAVTESDGGPALAGTGMVVLIATGGGLLPVFDGAKPKKRKKKKKRKPQPEPVEATGQLASAGFALSGAGELRTPDATMLISARALPAPAPAVFREVQPAPAFERDVMADEEEDLLLLGWL